MPDTYDYTQDKDFLSAPVPQQQAYLKANDPDFAKSDPKTQGAYIAHLRGYDQPTQFEKDNAPQKESGGAAWRATKGVGRGLNDLVEGAYQTVAHPLDTANAMATSTEQHVKNGMQEPSTIGKMAEFGAAVPGLGPLGQSLGKRAAGGDYAGAISEGLTNAVAPAALGEAKGLVPNAREAIGKRSYTPEGTLKKLPAVASRLAAGGAGELSHIPGAGTAGLLLGPDMYKAAFPNPIADQIEKAKFMNKGYKPVAAPGASAQAAGEEPVGGQDLLTRMKPLVRPGEEPTSADLKRAGDMTQAPVERLRALAKFGDKLAENELRRRLQH